MKILSCATARTLSKCLTKQIGLRSSSAFSTTTAKAYAISSSEDADSAKPRLDSSSASNLMDIGIRRIFNDSHDMFRSNVRRFMQEEILPHQVKWEKQGYVDKEAYLKAGSNGLMGIDVPVEYGGSGGTFTDAAVAYEEQFYINEASMQISLHSGIILPYMLHYGTEEQKQKYLPKMVSGECMSCIAMTEPGAGSDLQGIKTFAKKDGDDFILNGSKTFISLGYVADVAIVVAVTDTEAKNKSRGISLFLVDRDTPGFSRGAPLQKMGLKGSDTAELFFDDVRLHKSKILGRENQGFVQLMNLLPTERLIIGLNAMAHAEWMFETTRQYVKERKAFGKTISALQVIQHRLAEMKTNICVTRAFIDQCILSASEGTLDSMTASMAKLAATEVAYEVADACVQMHGGWGYMYEYGICRAFTNTRVMRIYGGTNEIMKELIARPIVKG